MKPTTRSLALTGRSRRATSRPADSTVTLMLDSRRHMTRSYTCDFLITAVLLLLLQSGVFIVLAPESEL